ncbi:ABC transporter ATP-binding protein [Nordella sp. HKS 07]|uniref:ABC transporter ATP-binding protein n=1 Tax=Nordella sp. HKS 07 TaxID=2712222 RepID=UPI0013E1BE68|nr:ABC transporter ATP-binding protein [Nordella sp. HKS 07]QIG47386.1 ABC transporter ATP-binding protein [Nordella sp. HKS 07]
MPVPLLEIEDLRVRIPSRRGEVKAVDGLFFSVAQGEVVGIVGESGSGKSMLALSMLQLIPKPGRITGGRIALEGRDLVKLSEREMRQVRGNDIGMIFQDPSASLNPVLRIGRQVAETIEAHHHVTPAQSWRRSVEMLQGVRIPDPQARARDYPHQYSGGMRQRVMIAMGMANAPKLLIADEPTTALDVTVQAQIMGLLGRMNKETGTAIILISHNIALVSRFCTRVLVMYAGRIVEAGPTRDVFAAPCHPYTRALLNAVPRIDRRVEEGLQTIAGRPPDLAALPEGCAFEPRCPARFRHCTEQQPPVFPTGEGRFARCWLADTHSTQQGNSGS